jgi:hypothetical protein
MSAASWTEGCVYAIPHCRTGRSWKSSGSISPLSEASDPDSGSVLILYDSAELPRERLIAVGTAWAVFLDDVYAGKKPEAPGC